MYVDNNIIRPVRHNGYRYRKDVVEGGLILE
jgi:hypothetical protein